MPATKKRLTDQERAERRRADRQFAREAVERLRTSEGWQTWLATRKRFHRYSLSNQLLIAMQQPTATRVAGFRAWLGLGYTVQRGEKAIRIWVPIPPSRKQIELWEKQGGDSTDRPRTHFRLGPVFDREQVAPLPPPTIPAPLDPPVHEITGDDLAYVLPGLSALGLEIGSVVEFEAMTGPRQGYYELESRRIAIREDIAPNAQVKTLIHELAHALLRAEPAEDDPKLTRAAEELVVESVAYTVCGALGLDSAGYSIPYLAAWATRDNIETLERTAALIDRLARRIETVVLPDDTRAYRRGEADTGTPGG
jgi:N-terminal domain of anti-restriction factor ArdC/IrrE N-terminal-like domain